METTNSSTAASYTPPDFSIIRKPRSGAEQETLLVEAGSLLHTLKFLLFNWSETIEVTEDDACGLAGVLSLVEEMVNKAVEPLPGKP